jgi:hypothetical protein
MQASVFVEHIVVSAGEINYGCFQGQYADFQEA